MRAYARQAKNKQLEAQAAEIRFRAERRIGELMAAQKDAGQMAAAGRPSEEIGSKTNPISKPPTLEEVGIDKKLADRARKYAAIPEDEFNGIVDDWRERVETENARVTVDLLKAGQRAEEEAKDVTPAPEPEPDPYRKGLSALTREGLEDEVAGLRAEVADLRKRVEDQRSQIADLKGKIKELSSDNKGATISSLQKRVEAANYRRDEALRVAKREEYKRKMAEKRAAELEQIEVPYD